MKSHEFLREDKKKQTRTQTRPEVDTGPDLRGPVYEPLEPYREPQQRQQPRTEVPQRNVAGQQSTLRATQGVANSDMARMLSRMRDIEADADDPGYPEEPTMDIAQRVTTNNLPAVAGANLQAAGVQNPDWHKVANLPGNMQQAIRTLGRRLFRSMTNTPTDQIHMIANLGGRGPNTSQEVNAVVNWIQDHGRDLGPGDIDFDATLPGYSADIHQYTAGGIRWLLVQDQFGRYIYSWPESDSLDTENTASLTQRRTALPR